MTAAWLRSFFKLSRIDESTLRAMLTIYAFLGVRSKYRDAIALELGARAMVAWVEARLHTTIGWCRGGKS